jgi:hypothetical protein
MMNTMSRKEHTRIRRRQLDEYSKKTDAMEEVWRILCLVILTVVISPFVILFLKEIF